MSITGAESQNRTRPLLCISIRNSHRNAVPDSGGADDGSADVPSERMRLEPNVTCVWSSLEHRRGDDYVDDGTNLLIQGKSAAYIGKSQEIPIGRMDNGAM
jgi:hypothetical protein